MVRNTAHRDLVSFRQTLKAVTYILRIRINILHKSGRSINSVKKLNAMELNL